MRHPHAVVRPLGAVLLVLSLAFAVVLAGADADGNGGLGGAGVDGVPLGARGAEASAPVELVGPALYAKVQAWNGWYNNLAPASKVYKHYYRRKLQNGPDGHEWKNPYVQPEKTEKYFQIDTAAAAIRKSIDEGDIFLTPAQKRNMSPSKYREVFDAIDHVFRGSEKKYQFLVGGYVRDLILPEPIESKDVDVGAMCDPKEMEVVCARNRWHCNTLEYAFFNIFKWGFGLDGFDEHVTAVETLPATISVAASNAWRDFTVNAIYFDLNQEVFIDSTGYGVQDAANMKLRIANYGNGELMKADYIAKKKWFDFSRFFDDTWYKTGTGDRKLARWFHMRIKGFRGEYHSEKYVLNKMYYIAVVKPATDKDTSNIEDFIRQLDQQTFNNKSTRNSKLQKFFISLYDSYPEARPVNKSNPSDDRFNRLVEALYELFTAEWSADWGKSWPTLQQIKGMELLVPNREPPRAAGAVGPPRPPPAV